jgi:branched-chain amino acid transport system ATP-binding protein
MLSLEGISVGYGARIVVRDLSMSVGDGEVVALVGANGAGKSSALKAIVGLADTPRGSIYLGGRRLDGLPSHIRIASGLGLSPEGRQVFPEMTVEENLRTAEAAKGDDRAGRLGEMLRLFPRLEERRHQRAETLSGGEQQMLAIARALMPRPRVLLLDEPTLGLAPIIVHQIARLIGQLRSQGLSILLAEQNAEMALKVSDRGYVLESGQLVMTGTSSVLLNDPAIQSAYMGL